MRILHLGKYYPPFLGGIESFMADLLPLQAQEDEVGALVHHHEARRPLGDAENVNGVTVWRMPILGRLLFTPVCPSLPFIINETVLRFRPDVIHAHLPNVAALWLPFLPACQDVPLVVHWHADVLASSHQRGLALAYPFYRPFERRVLRRAAAIVATSPPYLASSPALQEWRAKCQVIPLGLKQGAAPPVRAAAPAWPADPALRVLCVGRLTYYKGHEILVRALSRMPDAQALIVGEGEEASNLRDLLAQSGVADRVQLFGRASDSQLAGLLASCDLLCLASIERTEAFGLVLLEAMRAGKPVLATRVSGAGMSWVVDDGVTGVVVDPADANALWEGLEVMRDVDRRRKMGEAGAARFRHCFTIEQITSQIRALYRDVTRLSGT